MTSVCKLVAWELWIKINVAVWRKSERSELYYSVQRAQWLGWDRKSVMQN
jgi:hypothetical protein